MELFLGSLLIFALRIGDVSLASVRIVTLMRGRIGLAALLGFFESLFWVSAAAIVFTNLDHPIRIISFAAGFALRGPCSADSSSAGLPWETRAPQGYRPGRVPIVDRTPAPPASR